MAEIKAGSEQQSQGVEQVNRAIEQINQVTQETAASAQESAGAALELNSQAEDMKELVAGFILTGSRMIGTTKPAGLIPLETEPAEVEL